MTFGEKISAVIKAVDGWVWGPVLLVLLIRVMVPKRKRS